MHCQVCGKAVSDNAKFCKACGSPMGRQPVASPEQGEHRLVGFSPRINDPAFTNYIKNTYRWSAIFALILAVAAVVGFYIAGEVGTEMDNPGSLHTGLVIGGMFLAIALFQILGRKRSKTWDGTVADKMMKRKTGKRTYGNGDYSYEPYLEYSVIIHSDAGKKYYIRAKNDDTLYNYYRIGERVRHHAGLNSYEKYDKRNDTFIPCNACASLNDIDDDICFRCRCPLLK